MFLRQATSFVSGEPVENPHPAIVIFSECSAMNWAVLPVAGGIYDQDPMLMDYFRKLWDLQAKHEKAERAKQKNKNSKPSSRR